LAAVILSLGGHRFSPGPEVMPEAACRLIGLIWAF
jgi:hypothetical protein